MASKEESTVSVTMDRDDKVKFDTILSELRMTQKAALGQLITWFQRQEPMLRAIVMGHVPEDYAGDIIEVIYNRRQQLEAGGLGSDSESAQYREGKLHELVGRLNRILAEPDESNEQETRKAVSK